MDYIMHEKKFINVLNGNVLNLLFLVHVLKEFNLGTILNIFFNISMTIKSV